jgi:sec-independent protein translocase protein TatA
LKRATFSENKTIAQILTLEPYSASNRLNNGSVEIRSMAFGDPLQWIVIGVIVIAIFLWGPQKLPELARGLGRAKKEFENASKEVEGSMTGIGQSASVPKSADQVLLETARQLGISTEGKTREQISQEIVAKARA